MRIRRIIALLFTLSGCATSSEPTVYSCLLPGEQRMLVAELFFGRGFGGRQRVTDAQWAEFVAKTVTPSFPDGFTVFDGEGQWRNPGTGEITGERTKILLIATKRAPDLAGPIRRGSATN